MSNVPNQETDPKATAPATPPPQDQDYLLAALTYALSGSGATFNLTLLVQGTTVTGTAIGVDEYSKRLSEQFADMWRPLGVERDWHEAFGLLGELEGQPEAGQRPFVYLKEATIFSPDGSRFRTPLWRSHLAHVGGWTFGTPDLE
ncbi:MAG: hypothetical protein M3R02_01275 [Chloroflexota bacterium]|nr:hypothetical protein [Chloroflexota bacterium]